MSTSSETQTSERQLLPTNVSPTHYALWLDVHLDKFEFDGRVEISLLVNDSCDAITLHAIDLDFDASKVVFKQNGAERIPSTALKFNKEEETVAIQFGKSLSNGSNGVLEISFKGTLNDNLVGFYRSSYTHNGEKKFMATTQFEATDARRCFPCFDEPLLKATFGVTLVIPKSLTALSNMPVADTKDCEKNADKKVVRFHDSVKMSTYLLAFLVGEFEYVEDFTAEGVPVRCYTTPGKKDQANFALRVGVHSLSFFTKYFELPYPLPKLDMIAVPDFAAGAMENYGCVTYREIAILVDDANSSVGSKQGVAITVAHELAHQWFGNLVTMSWWSDLWLNESFATWISYLAVDSLFPEWKIWDNYVYTDYIGAFKLDALRSSHPIEVEVRSSGQINEIFDAISYSKGSAVIRMLEAYLGHDSFRAGLRVYLKRHSFGNAATADLWKALGETSGRPVEDVMNLYTQQTGFPLVSIAETTKSGDSARSFLLSQERFLLEKASAEELATLWKIPVSILVEGITEPIKLLLSEKSSTFSLPASVTASNWIKVNADQTGFYRVRYESPQLLESVLSHVQSSLREKSKQSPMTPSDRLGLISDVFAVSRMGRMKTSEALRSLSAFVDEEDSNVWSDLISNLMEVAIVWANEGEDVYNDLSRFARSIVSPLAKRCGWDSVAGESSSASILRSQALRTAGLFGDSEVISQARSKFDQFLKNNSTLHPDLRSTVYAIVVANGGESEYNKLINLYETTELHEEKIRALSSLGFTPLSALIENVLDYSLSEKVRSQDCFFALRSLSVNRFAKSSLWHFLRSRWEELDRRFSQGNMNLIGRFITSSTAGFATEAQANEVANFFQDKKVPSAERTIQQSIEKIRLRSVWLERDRVDVAQFVKNFK